jgi:hypothetical protein
VWILLLGLLAAQEPDVRALIERLNADDPQERSTAAAELVRVGPKALPALREAASRGSTEAQGRAKQAIQAIEDAELLKTLCPEPKRVSIAKKGTLREAFDAVAKQAGIPFEMEINDLDGPCDATFENASLFDALDRLCAGRPITWRNHHPGLIQLRAQRHLPVASVYPGPFRIQAWLRPAGSGLQLTLRADHERSLKRMLLPVFNVTEVRDEKDRKLETRLSTADADPDAAVGTIATDAGSLKLLKGTVTFRFAAAGREIAFDAVAEGATAKLGDVTATISDVYGSFLTIDFQRGKPGRLLDDLEARLELVAITDRDGKAREGGELRSARGLSNMHLEDLQERPFMRVYFPEREGHAVKSLKLRYVDRFVEKVVPFEFKELK